LPGKKMAQPVAVPPRDIFKRGGQLAFIIRAPHYKNVTKTYYFNYKTGFFDRREID